MANPLKYERIAALLERIKVNDVTFNPEPTGLFAPKLTPQGFLKVFFPAALGLDRALKEYDLPVTDYEGFSVYCSQQDNPGGNLYQHLNAPNGFWARSSRGKSNLTKPSSGLATFYWSSSDPDLELNEITLCTEAQALLSDNLIRHEGKEFQNRPEDVAWAQQKLNWLWRQTFPSLALPKVTLINIEHPKAGEIDWP